jgi:hypothetical protein
MSAASRCTLQFSGRAWEARLRCGNIGLRRVDGGVVDARSRAELPRHSALDHGADARTDLQHLQRRGGAGSSGHRLPDVRIERAVVHRALGP